MLTPLDFEENPYTSKKKIKNKAWGNKAARPNFFTQWQFTTVVNLPLSVNHDIDNTLVFHRQFMLPERNAVLWINVVATASVCIVNHCPHIYLQMFVNC